MAKKKQTEDIQDLILDIEIKSATLKDAFCNYSYELKTGPTAGDELSRSGASIVHEDLFNAFYKLNVHIAFLDAAFSGHVIDDIDAFHQHEITGKYTANGFKIVGAGDNEAIVLTGVKNVDFGTIDIKTPKLRFDGYYNFINELRAAIDDCLKEVDAYMRGKCAPKFIQSEMEFNNEDEDFE